MCPAINYPMTKHRYTSCYCEENIWHLCADPAVPGTQKLVLWMGSLQPYCPLWFQRSSECPDQEPVWWDYHVVLLAFTDQWRVWDLDTTLDLPVSAASYFSQTFRAAMLYPPVFRVMDSDYYQRTFSSDRSHMLGADGQWLVAPPSWPAIQHDELTFADMLNFESNLHGSLMGFNELLSHFCCTEAG